LSMSTHGATGCEGNGRVRQSLWYLEFTSVSRFVLIAASLIFLYGCSNTGASAGAAAPGGGGGGKGGGRGGRGAGGDVPVTVAKASQKDVPVEVQVIGNVEASTTITVKAQAGGQLTRVHFNEGDFVKKGELLFSIDPRPLEAILNQALANVSKDEEVLGQVQANMARDSAQARYADAQAKRCAELAQGGIISKNQADRLRAIA